MSLVIGEITANSGMAKAIYDQLCEVIELKGLSEDDRNLMRESWKKLSFAIAKGVIDHITELAETTSDESTDDIFWNWIAQVNNWLSKLANWQSDFVDAFKKWESTDPDYQALKKALIEVEGPGAPPAQAPTSLKGEIE